MWTVAYVAGLIFAAGVSWAQFRRMRKDLNGVGKKLNEHIERNRKEHLNQELAMLAAASEEKRNELIERFWKD